jgi:hypothetical protein
MAISTHRHGVDDVASQVVEASYDDPTSPHLTASGGIIFSIS